MIADIAKDTRGVLGWLADVLTSLTKNWESYSKGIMSAVVALSAYRAIVASIGAIQSLAALSISWPAVIGAVAAGMAAAMADAAMKAEYLQDVIDDIKASAEAATQQSEESEKTSKRYLGVLKETTSKESERALLLAKQKLAFEKLKEEYPDLLRYMSLEKMTLEDINRIEGQIEKREQTKKTKALEDKLDEFRRRADHAKKEYETYNQRNEDKKAGKLSFVENLITDLYLNDEFVTKKLTEWTELEKEAAKAYAEWNEALNGGKTPDVPEEREKWKKIADSVVDKYPDVKLLRKPNKDEGIYAYFDYLEVNFKEAKEEL